MTYGMFLKAWRASAHSAGRLNVRHMSRNCGMVRHVNKEMTTQGTNRLLWQEASGRCAALGRSIQGHMRAVHAAPSVCHDQVDEEESDADFQRHVKAHGSGGGSDAANNVEDGIMERIKGDVTGDKVVLYMKGLPSAPQCGFSLRTVQILRAIGVEFRAYNVLANQELREGVKRFSHWPTIPQLYVGGEFIGGCDIVEQMAQSGELQTIIRESGANMPEESKTS